MIIDTHNYGIKEMQDAKDSSEISMKEQYYLYYKNITIFSFSNICIAYNVAQLSKILKQAAARNKNPPY